MLIDDVLRDIPSAAEDLEGGLSRALDAAVTVGAKAVVTAKITITPKGVGGRVEVAVAVDEKLPRERPDTLTFFLTPEGELSRRDSRQLDLEDALKSKGT